MGVQRRLPGGLQGAAGPPSARVGRRYVAKGSAPARREIGEGAARGSTWRRARMRISARERKGRERGERGAPGEGLGIAAAALVHQDNVVGLWP